jgi:hypothetical protein
MSERDTPGESVNANQMVIGSLGCISAHHKSHSDWALRWASPSNSSIHCPHRRLKSISKVGITIPRHKKGEEFLFESIPRP